MKVLIVYKATDGYRIRIVNRRNGRIVADGGEAYVSHSNAARAAHNNWKDGFDLVQTYHDNTVTRYRMEPKK